MLPIVIDPAKVSTALVGSGDLLARRLKLLKSADLQTLQVFIIGPAPQGVEGQDGFPSEEDLRRISVLFIAGLPRQISGPLVKRARSSGVLVNTEDDRELCDFHVPASLRRGDLVMTVSTGGGSPGLARRLKGQLEATYGEEWSERLKELTEARRSWRERGLDFASLVKESDAFIDRKGWLK